MGDTTHHVAQSVEMPLGLTGELEKFISVSKIGISVCSMSKDHFL